MQVSLPEGTDLTLGVHHYNHIFAPLENGEGRREPEDKDRGKLVGTRVQGGEEKPARTTFYICNLVSGINKGTCSHEDLLWLIAVVYVSNYQVSYVIILYP